MPSKFFAHCSAFPGMLYFSVFIDGEYMDFQIVVDIYFQSTSSLLTFEYKTSNLLSLLYLRGHLKIT